MDDEPSADDMSGEDPFNTRDSMVEPSCSARPSRWLERKW
jgi:hypothetical protein